MPKCSHRYLTSLTSRFNDAANEMPRPAILRETRERWQTRPSPLRSVWLGPIASACFM